MKLDIYSNTEAFTNAALDSLMRDEIQNNLIISFALNLNGLKTENWLLATVSDNGVVLLTAMMMPQYNIILYESGNQPNDKALSFFIDEIRALGITPPGVIAESGLAERFAQKYTKNSEFSIHMKERVLRLDEVLNRGDAKGAIHEFNESDMFFAPYWTSAFATECHLAEHERTLDYQIANMKRLIGRGKLFYWEDRGIPVSMAASHRDTVNGAGVGYVYTPPIYRGKGYATRLVAEISQMRLDSGKKFCFLFTDAANPTSNGIYEKIGFYFICNYEDIKFR